jgi:hypothetical protein
MPAMQGWRIPLVTAIFFSAGRSPTMNPEPSPSNPAHYYLLLVREGWDWPEVHEFPNRDELVVFLKGVRRSSLHAIKGFIFHGHRLYFSKGTYPFRYLLDGDQDPIPLFDVEISREPDPEDYLHDEPIPEPDPDFEAFLRSQLDQAKKAQGPEPEV